jgi:putative iron-only hydrogenase system regulator
MRKAAAYQLFIPYVDWHRVFCMEAKMDTRIALIGIMVEDMDAVERLNGILHEYGKYIIGRMGLPLRDRNLNIISIVVDAEADIISSLAGKLGMVKGISVKAQYSRK